MWGKMGVWSIRTHFHFPPQERKNKVLSPSLPLGVNDLKRKQTTIFYSLMTVVPMLAVKWQILEEEYLDILETQSLLETHNTSADNG